MLKFISSYLLLLCLLCNSPLLAQNLLYTQNGKISFHSDAPIEDIDAVNSRVNSVLNKENGSISFKLPVNAFIFPNKLMQEHFNETYLETHKYPYCEFKGRIMDFANVPLGKAGAYNVTVTGDLTLHGVTRTITERGQLTVKESGTTLANSTFKIKLEDYKIKIPSVVVSNIAEIVDVTVDLSYEPYKK